MLISIKQKQRGGVQNTSKQKAKADDLAERTIWLVAVYLTLKQDTAGKPLTAVKSN